MFTGVHPQEIWDSFYWLEPIPQIHSFLGQTTDPLLPRLFLKLAAWHPTIMDNVLSPCGPIHLHPWITCSCR
jgi:hypothetical protein